MKRNKIFISGPITNNPSYRRQFKDVESSLRYKGYRPVNPTRLRLFGKPMECYPWHVCMVVCLWHLLWCSHVFMMFGWANSRGARIENKFARILNKRIFNYKAEKFN